jgi:hypothetical protein
VEKKLVEAKDASNKASIEHFGLSNVLSLVCDELQVE